MTTNSGAFKKGEKRPNQGRPRGLANKATQDVRQAIALFAENNVSKLEEWLNATASGDPENNVKPDPAKAADLFLKAIEYHIPKLGRIEHTGEGGGPVQVIASATDERI